mmetsp:Transcript_13784/g.20192  ORF Transcript_13784/g.20192 Transcript_13784/m.20192 type:complete len:148 (-) Transcript_13784:17-460(-)|eukprot:CAMPEP_0194048996 /NCGR_PEP_ID=MMETSP0009_2-20130614/29295_1 /TAXON_ID=210454 /ORGANISM="Grammatophora oceanica, Strain CCMP 410" /LENGTH=147 /DNA_ID=CAMNT_0038695047 /DNA_START=298 /DNA_END=741 /DNA_ORIENTATION=+
MELTEEQRERIERNRQRALEIKRKREQEQKEETEPKEGKKRRVLEEEDVEIDLEDFEVNAPLLVNKTEAMQIYCLPEGTLAVCEFVEKPNPHHKNWTPMKLYKRAEIRKRARKRWGGVQGLIEERNRREERRFRKDLQDSKDIFKSK